MVDKFRCQPTSTFWWHGHLHRPVLELEGESDFVTLDARARFDVFHHRHTDPATINLSMVMNTLEGNTSPLDCFTYPSDCMFADSCAQQEVWKSLEESIQSLLSNTTLAHLAQRQSFLRGQGMYQI